MMKESVDKECATSACTPLVTRRVKRQPYLFSYLLMCFTFRGLKESTPTFEMGVRPLGGHRVGSGFTFRLLQDEH